MITRFMILLIGIYRFIFSPMLGPCCRHHPSCSRYAVEALSSWGAFKGTLLTIHRLLRCHPFHEGGYDPPPLPSGRKSLPAGRVQEIK